MRASVLTGPGESAVVRVADPVPGPGQLLLRVMACGVCRTDLEPWRRGTAGVLPLGHETAGYVVAVGAGVHGFRVGDRVAGLVPGGFAEYAVADPAAVVPLPDRVPFSHGLAEPLGCVVHAASRIPPILDTNVAVVGAGFMGLLSVAVLAGSRPRALTAVTGRSDGQVLALRAGATDVAAPEVLSRQRVAEPDADRLDDGFDLVVETSGTQTSLDLAGELVRTHGTLLVMGYHQDGRRTVPMALWNWKAISVVNGHVRRVGELATAMRQGVRLVEAGAVPMSTLVTAEVPIERVDDAFQRYQHRRAGDVKTVIRFG
jgi:threonine dehydrogenase-like Zn-dependent dehydrogenase